MNLSKQAQKATDGSTAVQAQGDVIIHNGMSPAQMTEVMVALLSATRRFTDEAMQTVNARQAEFQEAILVQMADTEKANSEAFGDPDFQYTLGNAQEAFARSGDTSVKETLADIIARRSKAETGTRLALTLNDAATRAANLTLEDFATLSLVYLVRYTVHQGINNVASFETYVRDSFLPFVSVASGSRGALWHIEGQGCGRQATGQIQIRQAWLGRYGGVLGKGISMEQAFADVDEAHRQLVEPTLISCIRDDTMYQPNAISEEAYIKTYAPTGMPEKGLKKIWAKFEASIPDGEEFINMLEPNIPGFREFLEKWDGSYLKNLELNAVGIAVAHANAARVIGLKAPLSIWIT